MAKKYFVSIILLTVTMLFAAGCAENRALNTLKKDYGNSARLVKRNQILNPEAAKNLEPVYGFDSNAAGAAIDGYRKGFTGQPAPMPYLPTVQMSGSMGSASQ